MPSVPTAVSRPVPPVPASQPAPPKISTQPQAQPPPAPPARPVRGMIQATPTDPSSKHIAVKSNNPFDTSPKKSLGDPNEPFSTNSQNKNSTHILDRENSIIDYETSEPDPFDTGFAKFPNMSVPHQYASNPPSVGTSISILGDHIDGESSTDALMTKFASSTSDAFQANVIQDLSDPFDTSNITQAKPALTINTIWSGNESQLSSLAPTISPPPLPQVTDPLYHPLNQLDQTTSIPCSAPPPPPPRPAVNNAPTFSPPPVPSRPNANPPPVPKRL